MELTIEQLKSAIEQHGYITDKESIVTTFLALKLEKPLLVEGPP